MNYRRVCTALAVFAFCSGLYAEPAARLDWVQKVTEDSAHHAFTDLAYWKGAFYLCFRTGTSHGSMDGIIQILRSADARTWELCGTLDTFGDDRDPHFTATPDILFVYFGVWDLRHGDGSSLPDRGSIRTHAASTTDGQTWSKIKGLYEPGWWMWRVLQHNGIFYSAAYTAIRPTPKERELRLLTSPDGWNWSMATLIANKDMPSESALWMETTGALRLITRMSTAINTAMAFRSDPEHLQWTAAPVGTAIHSPVVAQWKDRIYLAGRGQKDKGYVTRLWELTGDRAVERLTLPSSGDTSYPGLIVDPATPPEAVQPALLISWYSQHECCPPSQKSCKKADVYVGRIVLEP